MFVGKTTTCNVRKTTQTDAGVVMSRQGMSAISFSWGLFQIAAAEVSFDKSGCLHARQHWVMFDSILLLGTAESYSPSRHIPKMADITSRYIIISISDTRNNPTCRNHHSCYFTQCRHTSTSLAELAEVCARLLPLEYSVKSQ